MPSSSPHVDDVLESTKHVMDTKEGEREAKAAVAQQNAAVGSTLRAVKGALERKKGD